MREVVIKVQGCKDKTIEYEFVDHTISKVWNNKKILPPKTNIKSVLTKDKKLNFLTLWGKIIKF